MKHIWENNWFFIPIAMFFGFCGTLAILVPYSDEVLFFNDFRYEPINSAFRFLTHCGEEWAYIGFGLAVLFLKRGFAVLIALTGFLALPSMYLLKDAAGVDRPITYFEKRAAIAQPVLVPSVDLNRGQTSFPSGHSMASFALYSLLTLMAGHKYKRWGLAFAMLAILVGISRIFLVQHFLADVLAGALLGLFLSGLVWRAGASFLTKSEQ